MVDVVEIHPATGGGAVARDVRVRDGEGPVVLAVEVDTATLSGGVAGDRRVVDDDVRVRVVEEEAAALFGRGVAVDHHPAEHRRALGVLDVRPAATSSSIAGDRRVADRQGCPEPVGEQPAAISEGGVAGQRDVVEREALVLDPYAAARLGVAVADRQSADRDSDVTWRQRDVEHPTRPAAVHGQRATARPDDL